MSDAVTTTAATINASQTLSAMESSGASGTSASGSSAAVTEVSRTKVTHADGSVTLTITYSDGTKKVTTTPGDMVVNSDAAKQAKQSNEQMITGNETGHNANEITAASTSLEA